MRLRRAVLQTPPSSSVRLGLPLHNSCTLLTHSASTLPQVLIPLHFNSFKRNTYKKPPGGYPTQDHKVSQLVTPFTSPIRSHRNAYNPYFFIHLCTFSITPGGYPSRPFGNAGIPKRSEDPLFHYLAASLHHYLTGRGSRATAPLVPTYRCAATRKVPESRLLLLGSAPGNISAPPGV
jgi:hypothetical protein